MNQINFCIIVAALCACCVASPFTDCGSTTGQVSSVEVSDCPDGQDVCILKKGTQAGVKIYFISKADSKSLKAVVHGIIVDVPIPFPLPQPDACKTGVTCPVQNGKSYTYDNSLSIRNSYPEMSVMVKFELKDDTGADMACIEIPCKIE